MALILALKSRRVELFGVTTVSGNVSLRQTTRNACRILDYLGADTPVSAGASRPLRVPPYHSKRVHGKDGLGDSPLLPSGSRRRLERATAPEFMARSVESGVRTIVATGPLTNIALAFQKDPETLGRLHELVIMGGAIHVPGNVDSLSEFNFYSDPDAADYVLQETKVPKVLVPLDATHQVILTHEGLNRIRETETGKLVKSIFRTYVEGYRAAGLQGSPLHDPLAMGYCLERRFLELRPLFLRVETSGKYTRGACVPEERRAVRHKPNVKAAVSADSRSFLEYVEGALT